MTTLTTCVEPGCGRVFKREKPRQARCNEHQRIHDKKHNKRSYRTTKAANRRKQAVAAHVKQHGWVCPGYGREPHPAYDLTADHIKPRAAGGSEWGKLAVLCRSCNSRKGAIGGGHYPWR